MTEAEKSSKKSSKVADFYTGRSVFITGATGFIGKVLIHKLLTACPGIGNIYLLIRPKRGQDPTERLKGLLAAPVFASVPSDQLAKLCALEGDITSPGLGLSRGDEESLVRDVSVVFHSAATVKFDEDLSKSLTMNVEGTLSVIRLARKIGPTRLASFVHVSTAFSHCYRNDTIQEQFYENEVSAEDMLEISKRINPVVLDSPEVTKAMVGKHPNTYTFTKALAEAAIKENASDLPLAIFRPSIVVASAKEPLPGWIDNLNGPTGLITGYGAGLIRSALVDRTKVADVIPVDMCTSMMCVIGWKTSKRQSLDENLNQSIPLYNFTSGQNKPFTWRDFEVLGKKHTGTYPFEYMLWLPGGSFKQNRLVDLVCRVLFQYIPAVFVDWALQLFGQKPFMWKIVTRITKAMAALEYFANREWAWSNNNVHALQDELDEADKQLFPSDLRSDIPDWDKYIPNYFYGVRTYVLKNDPGSINYCRKKYRVYQLLDVIVKGLFLYSLYLLGAYVLSA